MSACEEIKDSIERTFGQAITDEATVKYVSFPPCCEEAHRVVIVEYNSR